uniref:Secreted protein n=1 Tax=Rhipicephalus microplus TaxID=6941 RepID=A0A6G5A058_RHIMP
MPICLLWSCIMCLFYFTFRKPSLCDLQIRHAPFFAHVSSCVINGWCIRSFLCRLLTDYCKRCLLLLNTSYTCSQYCIFYASRAGSLSHLTLCTTYVIVRFYACTSAF